MAGEITLVNRPARELVRAVWTQGEKVDLLLTDPPWKFSQRIGASAAEDHYPTMDYAEIAEDLEVLAPLTRRMVLWLSNAHLGPFLWHVARRDWPAPITGGAWDKGPVDYGQGYHVAGRTEPWLLWTGKDDGERFTDRKVLLDSGCREPRQGHSMKPIAYQARMIRKWVPPGGLVVDPYAGYATVAHAVVMAGEGRRYVGSELVYERWKDARDALALEVAGG